jgi:hypothetical protein
VLPEASRPQPWGARCVRTPNYQLAGAVAVLHRPLHSSPLFCLRQAEVVPKGHAAVDDEPDDEATFEKSRASQPDVCRYTATGAPASAIPVSAATIADSLAAASCRGTWCT